MELLLKNLLALQERGNLHKYAGIAHHRAWLESKMSHPSFCPGGRQSNATCQLNCRPPHARPDCCSEDCPCDEGEGHCHRDADCAGGLICDSCKNVAGACCEKNDGNTTAHNSSSSSLEFQCDKCGVMGNQPSPRIVGGTVVTVGKQINFNICIYSSLFLTFRRISIPGWFPS